MTGSDCVCLSSDVIGKGDSPAVQIRLETCDYVGETKRTAWIEDRDGSKLRVPVRYRVTPEVFPEPEVASLGVFGAKDGARPEFAVELRTLVTDTSFAITGIESDDERLQIQVEEPLIRDGLPGQILVSLRKPIDNGDFRSTVWIKTDSPAAPRIRISVVGAASNHLACDRPVIDFGAQPLGTETTTELKQSHPSGAHVDRLTVVGVASAQVAKVLRCKDATAVEVTHSAKELGQVTGKLKIQWLEAGTRRAALIPLHGRVVRVYPIPDPVYVLGFSGIIRPSAGG